MLVVQKFIHRQFKKQTNNFQKKILVEEREGILKENIYLNYFRVCAEKNIEIKSGKENTHLKINFFRPFIDLLNSFSRNCIVQLEKFSFLIILKISLILLLKYS